MSPIPFNGLLVSPQSCVTLANVRLGCCSLSKVRASSIPRPQIDSQVSWCLESCFGGADSLVVSKQMI